MAAAVPESPEAIIAFGDRVFLKDKRKGVVSFIGPMADNEETFYGIILDDSNGENDDTVDKIRYFKCKNKHGIFVTKDKIEKSTGDVIFSCNKQQLPSFNF